MICCKNNVQKSTAAKNRWDVNGVEPGGQAELAADTKLCNILRGSAMKGVLSLSMVSDVIVYEGADSGVGSVMMRFWAQVGSFCGYK